MENSRSHCTSEKQQLGEQFDDFLSSKYPGWLGDSRVSHGPFAEDELDGYVQSWGSTSFEVRGENLLIDTGNWTTAEHKQTEWVNFSSIFLIKEL